MISMVVIIYLGHRQHVIGILKSSNGKRCRRLCIQKWKTNMSKEPQKSIDKMENSNNLISHFPFQFKLNSTIA